MTFVLLAVALIVAVAIGLSYLFGRHHGATKRKRYTILATTPFPVADNQAAIITATLSDGVLTGPPPALGVIVATSDNPNVTTIETAPGVFAAFIVQVPGGSNLQAPVAANITFTDPSGVSVPPSAPVPVSFDIQAATEIITTVVAGAIPPSGTDSTPA